MPEKTPSQLLAEGAMELGMPLSEGQVLLFMRFLSELLSWNARFNLTAITDEREIVIKHYLDSLAFFSKFSIPHGCRTVDIGAGAGFPGIPLKIARPDIELTLVESSRKKAAFLHHIISELGLKAATVFSMRAEDFGQEEANRDSFCLAVSRAVAGLPILLEYALPLLKISGRFVAYKAKGAMEEALRSEKAAKLLGGRVEEIAKVVVPFLNAERYLVSVKKIAPSPQIYPRKAGVPAKKPLA